MNHHRQIRRVESLESRICLSSDPIPVASINVTVDVIDVANNSSDIEEFFEFEGEVFFRANDRIHGSELWKTDGTTDGTRMVKDIFDGAESSTPRNFYKTDKYLFFLVDSPRQDRAEGSRLELWRTDGSEDGTLRLKDVNIPYERDIPLTFATLGNDVFFAVGVGEGPLGIDLWKTDGSVAGTEVVKEFPLGTEDFPLGVDWEVLYVFDGELFFSASDHDFGQELWKTNGTTDGTTLVSDINPGPEHSFPFSFVELDERLFFMADVLESPEFYATYWFETDGTEGGTRQVSDVEIDWETEPIAHNGLIYFTGYTPETGYEPYRTDGTAEGTMLLKDAIPGPESTVAFSYQVYLDQVFFISSDTIKDELLEPQIWTSRGTPESTFKVVDDRLTSHQFQFVEYQNHVYFAATHPELGNELYRTDGTKEGVEVLDLNPGPGKFDAAPKIVFDGLLYFVGDNDGPLGYEVFRTDGTVEGTEAVIDIIFLGGEELREVLSFSPIQFGDALLMSAAESIDAGHELWRIDAVNHNKGIPGDIDGNGAVDFGDFLILSDNFGKSTTTNRGDINNDGHVNFFDFLILSDNYGSVASAMKFAALADEVFAS